jgi:acetolactate synthase-1/2/3 large subunit
MWGKYPGDDPDYQSPKGHRSQADEDDVAEILNALLAAKRPIIVAGHGVLYAEASDELKALAELLQIPVATTLLGKSGFPENYELSLGTSGRTLTKTAGHFANEADFILGVGTSFTLNDFTARMPTGKVLGQITNDPADIGKCRVVSCAAIGDAKFVINQLIRQAKGKLGDTGRERATETIEEISILKAEFHNEWAKRLHCNDDGPISPYRIIHEMNTLFDKSKSVVTHDAGNSLDQIVPFYEATSPRGCLAWGKFTQLVVELSDGVRGKARVAGGQFCGGRAVWYVRSGYRNCCSG